MTMMMRGSLLLAGLALSMTLQSSRAANLQSPGNISSSLTITDRQGHSHLWTVELARTPAEQEKGERTRSTVPDGTGMLFLFTPPQSPAMWMRETAMPLDIVFIGTNGRITDIVEKAVPFSESKITGQGRSVAVLEVKGGAMEKNGIVVGDRVISRALSFNAAEIVSESTAR